MAGARPTWKGVLQISRVAVPIKVYPATEASETLSFNQLHESCQTRISQPRRCEKCDRTVPSEEIVKAFEFEPGKYVILRPEELDAVAPPSTRIIALTQFAEASAVEWRAIDRAYWLAPDGPDGGPADDAYAVLVAAMAHKVGIGTVALYGREYLVAVSPLQGCLMLYTLHHAAELRVAPHPAALTSLTRFARGTVELTMARQVIGAMTGPLTLAHFTDQYQVDLHKLIAAKIAGEEIVVPASVPETAAVGTLRDALEQSLAAVNRRTPTPAKAAMPAKRKRA